MWLKYSICEEFSAMNNNKIKTFSKSLKLLFNVILLKINKEEKEI